MKNLLFARKFMLAALATMCIASNVLATGISGTLVIENKSKGRHYSITVKPDGTFETPELVPGSYTFKCTLTTSDGKTAPGSAAIEYALFNPKEIGLDHSSQKRVNKIEALCVKQKVVGSHSSDATCRAARHRSHLSQCRSFLEIVGWDACGARRRVPHLPASETALRRPAEDRRCHSDASACCLGAF